MRILEKQANQQTVSLACEVFGQLHVLFWFVERKNERLGESTGACGCTN